MGKITIGEMIRLLIVGAVITVVVFFRCKSLFKEENKPSQHHITAKQCEKCALNASK